MKTYHSSYSKNYIWIKSLINFSRVINENWMKTSLISNTELGRHESNTTRMTLILDL